MTSLKLPQHMLKKLCRFPQDWLFPFLQDSIFYVCFSTIFALVFGCVLGGPSIAAQTRIWWAMFATWSWQWVLMFGYMGLQRSKAIRSRFYILEGELAEEFRKTYALPENLIDPGTLGFHDMKWNTLLNTIVYVVCGAMAFHTFAYDSWAAAPAGIFEVVRDTIILMVLFDVLIYVSHWILHEYAYAWHRDHHKSKATQPLGTWYMHILDLFLELWIPIFMPQLLLRVNWLTSLTYHFLVEWDGVHSHGGLDFWPGVVPTPRRHWLHHKFNCVNYSPGLGDYFFDTECRQRLSPEGKSE